MSRVAPSPWLLSVSVPTQWRSQYPGPRHVREACRDVGERDGKARTSNKRQASYSARSMAPKIAKSLLDAAADLRDAVDGMQFQPAAYTYNPLRYA
jgi:hypothetical protein